MKVYKPYTLIQGTTIKEKLANMTDQEVFKEYKASHERSMRCFDRIDAMLTELIEYLEKKKSKPDLMAITRQIARGS